MKTKKTKLAKKNKGFKVHKRKRGRPKGSKNKVKKSFNTSHRLHSAWSYKRRAEAIEVAILRERLVKISKFLGYCSCGNMIANRDKRTPRLYFCASCGKRKAVSKLKAENPKKRMGPIIVKEHEEHIEQLPEKYKKIIDKASEEEDIVN
jgi:hypothetical protein